MANLTDVVFYILQKYPHENELSNARVTKMIYLSDWHQAINQQHQITDIEWYFNNYGPFVWDVRETVEQNPTLFEMDGSKNSYGDKKLLFKLKTSNFTPTLKPCEKKSIDHVISVTQDMPWGDFIKLVYSTHPVMSSERYADLSLVEKAREYAEQYSLQAQ